MKRHTNNNQRQPETNQADTKKEAKVSFKSKNIAKNKRINARPGKNEKPDKPDSKGKQRPNYKNKKNLARGMKARGHGPMQTQNTGSTQPLT